MATIPEWARPFVEYDPAKAGTPGYDAMGYALPFVDASGQFSMSPSTSRPGDSYARLLPGGSWGYDPEGNALTGPRIGEDGAPILMDAEGNRIAEEVPYWDPSGLYEAVASQYGAGAAAPLGDLRTLYSGSELPGGGVSWDQYISTRFPGARMQSVDGLGDFLLADREVATDWSPYTSYDENSGWDFVLKDFLPAALTMYGIGTGIGNLANLAGIGGTSGTAGALGDAVTGIDSLADFNGLTPGDYGALSGVDAAAAGAGAAGDPFIDAYTPDMPSGGASPGGYEYRFPDSPAIQSNPSLTTVPTDPIFSGAPSYLDPSGAMTTLGAAGAGAGLASSLLTPSNVIKAGTALAGLAGAGDVAGSDTLPGSDTGDAARARARASIAGLFGGGSDRYGGIRSSVLDFHKSNLDRDREEAARKLKFSLLRTGNAGGSLDVDERSRLGRTYDRGLLDVTNLADRAASDARASDEQTKLDLLARVDAGLDETSATQAATSAQKTAADRATSYALGQSLGNLFTDFGQQYQVGQTMRGLGDARRAYSNLFSGVPGASSGRYLGTTGAA